MTEKSGAVCVDLGSTVVKAALAVNGRVTERTSFTNPQIRCGPDVMSRIENADSLYALTAHAVDTAVARLTTHSARTIVVGNTVMLHLLCGVSPAGMGEYPYTPAFTAAQTFAGDARGIRSAVVETLPCASAFIGADVTAGFAAADAGESTVLYVDLGTNGEMILRCGGRLYGCSVAAGSAFGQGAGEKISRLYERLCRGELTRDGDAASQSLIKAKAAVCAGLTVLLNAAAVNRADVEAVYIAGGLRIDPEAAFGIGLLPEGLRGVRCVGNKALEGAVRAAAEDGFIERVRQTAEQTVTIPLALKPEFNEVYLRNLYLGRAER